MESHLCRAPRSLSGARRDRPTLRRSLGLSICALLLAPALTACSGDGTPTVPSLKSNAEPTAGSGAASNQVEQYLAKSREFAACIRAAGRPGMHDPDELGGFSREDLALLSGPEGTRIYRKCHPIISGIPIPQEIQAQRERQRADLLTDSQRAANVAYSKCIQNNGVPEFPDPQANGLLADPPWDLPGATVPRPPRLDQASKICRHIIDPEHP